MIKNEKFKKILYFICLVINFIIGLAMLIGFIAVCWPLVILLAILFVIAAPFMYIDWYEQKMREKERHEKGLILLKKLKKGEITDDQFDYEMEHL